MASLATFGSHVLLQHSSTQSQGAAKIKRKAQCVAAAGRDGNGSGEKEQGMARSCALGVSAAALGLGLLALPSCLAAQGDGVVGWIQQLLSQEPSNALSLPTWTIHVASVVEWVVAMILVWQYGGTKNNSAWKGLSWGMVPLLGGALCACTWHFFYNAESLEVLVVMQGALTFVGNITLWIAAYRIYQNAQGKSV